MENSHAFFNNSSCQYYPCHTGIEKERLNCLFCFCPLYKIEKCGGTYTKIGDIKDCSGCIFAHTPENYPKVIKILQKEAGV